MCQQSELCSISEPALLKIKLIWPKEGGDSLPRPEWVSRFQRNPWGILAGSASDPEQLPEGNENLKRRNYKRFKCEKPDSKTCCRKWDHLTKSHCLPGSGGQSWHALTPQLLLAQINTLGFHRGIFLITRYELRYWEQKLWL